MNPTSDDAAPAPTSAGTDGRRLRTHKGMGLVNEVFETVAPLAKALGLTTTTVFGGVSQGRQVSALRNGVDIAGAKGVTNLEAGYEITLADVREALAERVLRETPGASTRDRATRMFRTQQCATPLKATGLKPALRYATR